MSQDKEWSYAPHETGETVTEFTNMAQSEFNRIVEKIRKEQRRERILALRALGRLGRRDLRNKKA